jgi:hypothetical protein
MLPKYVHLEQGSIVQINVNSNGHAEGGRHCAGSSSFILFNYYFLVLE